MLKISLLSWNTVAATAMMTVINATATIISTSVNPRRSCFAMVVLPLQEEGFRFQVSGFRKTRLR
jgi:hypothetical protein